VAAGQGGVGERDAVCKDRIELLDDAGQRLRDVGAEYGSTTGRPRRCGWYDAVIARRVTRLNGSTALAITKLDVLSGLPEVQICVAYELDGQRIDDVPMHGFDRVKPVYQTMPGWQEDISTARTMDALPAAARDYLNAIERLTGAPIAMVSVGPDRDQTIIRRAIFR